MMRHLTGRRGFRLQSGLTLSRNGRPNVRVMLKGIHEVKARLASGETVSYFYAWRGGPRIKAKPGTDDFRREYDAAIAKRKAPPEGLLFTLIAEYKASSEFKQKSESTKRAYRAYIKMIEDEFGDMPIAALEQPAVRGVFKAWRDKMAETPRKADYAWVTLARILSVAKDRGRIAVNPCERGGRLYAADRTDRVWGEAEIAKLLSVCSAQVELALIMALWTGQRQGDLLRLPWSAYDGKQIKLTQSKTGRRVVIPAGAPLKAALKAAERHGPLILTNSYNKPWTGDGFRTSWAKACAKAEIAGLTFHDLRGSAVVRLAVNGATVPEIATFTGHSLKDVESILDAHYLGRDIRLAESAVRKLNRGEKRTKSVKRR